MRKEVRARRLQVTGGNKGIGLAIVQGLCRRFDGDVFLTARDAARGEAAVEQLRQLGLNAKFHQLDICCQESLNAFKKHLEESYKGLDILMNNAAIAFKDPTPFSVQAEQTIYTNYLQLVSTCQTLFPLLQPHALVVNLSSCEGHLMKIPGNQLRAQLSDPSLTEEELIQLMKSFVKDVKSGSHEEKGWPNSAYSVSKVGVNALTFMQHKKFNQDTEGDIVVNAVHPGLVATDMSSHKAPLSTEEGALLPPNVTAPRGAYVWWDRQIVDWTGPTIPPESI